MVVSRSSSERSIASSASDIELAATSARAASSASSARSRSRIGLGDRDAVAGEAVEGGDRDDAVRVVDERCEDGGRFDRRHVDGTDQSQHPWLERTGLGEATGGQRQRRRPQPACCFDGSLHRRRVVETGDDVVDQRTVRRSHRVERGDAHADVWIVQELIEQLGSIAWVDVREHQGGGSTFAGVVRRGEQANFCAGRGRGLVVAAAGQETERQEADVAVVVLGELGDIGRREVGGDTEVEAEPDVAHVVGEQEAARRRSVRRR